MRPVLLRGLSLLALLLALAWLIVDPSWEAGITAVVLLAGFGSTSLRLPQRVSAVAHGPAGESTVRGGPGLAVSEPANSLLVLPLRNIGAADYISDGLTEEINVDLSRIRSLRVISHGSALRLKGSERTPAELAAQLGVRYVLEGTVRQEGDRLRVTARLVNAVDGTDAWADRFDGETTSVLEMEREVARGIAGALEVELQPVSAGTAARLREDARAYEAYLKARHDLWDFSLESARRAVHHLENGLALTGENEALLATLGHVYTQFVQLGDADAAAYLDKAAEVAGRIHALDPDSAQGQRLRGLVEFQSGRLRTAYPYLKRAWQRDPTDPDTLLMYGYLLSLTGQMSSARLLFESLVSLDPLTPVSQAMPGFAAVLEGRFEDALGPYRRMFEMEPDAPFAAHTWAWALQWNRRFDEAAEVTERMRQRHPDSPFTLLGVGRELALTGRPDEALDVLAPIANSPAANTEFFARELAHCYAIAGDEDEGIAWLERNVEIGNINYPFLHRHDWFLDNLRGDGRFSALMERVRREWEAFEP